MDGHGRGGQNEHYDVPLSCACCFQPPCEIERFLVVPSRKYAHQISGLLNTIKCGEVQEQTMPFSCLGPRPGARGRRRSVRESAGEIVGYMATKQLPTSKGVSDMRSK